MRHSYERTTIRYGKPSLTPSAQLPQGSGTGLDGVGANSFKHSISGINCTFKDVTFMSSSGLTIPLAREPSVLANHVTIVETLILGHGVELNWGKMSTLYDVSDHKFLESLRLAINTKRQHTRWGSVEISLYYDIDISDIELSPNGIAIGESGWQVVYTEHVGKAVPYQRLAVSAHSIYTTPINERAPNSIAQNIEYYISYEGQADRAFMPMFLNKYNWIEPYVDPHRRPGLYITTLSCSDVDYRMGQDGAVRAEPKRSVTFIPLEDFPVHGIVQSIADLNTVMMTASKSPDKRKLDGLVKGMEDILSRKEKKQSERDDEWTDQFFNDSRFGISLNQLAMIAGKFTKIVREMKSPLNEI